MIKILFHSKWIDKCFQKQFAYPAWLRLKIMDLGFFFFILAYVLLSGSRLFVSNLTPSMNSWQ